MIKKYTTETKTNFAVLIVVATAMIASVMLIAMTRKPEIHHVYVPVHEIIEVNIYADSYYKLLENHRDLYSDYTSAINRRIELKQINDELMLLIEDMTIELEAFREAERRTLPLFSFENDVLRGHPDPSVELQWMIYDLVTEHDVNLEMVLGIIAHESNFNINSHNENGDWRGLAQISPFWLRSPGIEPYRLTDDYRDRCLFNPEHNMLTLIEMHEYFMEHNELDRHCKYAQNSFIWFHGSGRNKSEGFNGNSWTRTVWWFASQITHDLNQVRLTEDN